MTSSTNRRIRVRDATPADIDVLTDIHFDAFGTDVMGGLLSPGGISEEQKKKFGETLLPPSTPVPGEGETIVKVAELLPENDDGAAEVIAFGKWVLFRHPRPEEEWNIDIPYQTLEMLGEGANPEVHTAFLRVLHVKRRDLAKGDPVLSELYFISPKSQTARFLTNVIYSPQNPLHHPKTPATRGWMGPVDMGHCLGRRAARPHAPGSLPSRIPPLSKGGIPACGHT